MPTFRVEFVIETDTNPRKWDWTALMDGDAVTSLEVTALPDHVCWTDDTFCPECGMPAGQVLKRCLPCNNNTLLEAHVTVLDTRPSEPTYDLEPCSCCREQILPEDLNYSPELGRLCDRCMIEAGLRTCCWCGVATPEAELRTLDNGDCCDRCPGGEKA